MNPRTNDHYTRKASHVLEKIVCRPPRRIRDFDRDRRLCTNPNAHPAAADIVPQR
jgi:hypothetical protein